MLLSKEGNGMDSLDPTVVVHLLLLIIYMFFSWCESSGKEAEGVKMIDAKLF